MPGPVLGARCRENYVGLTSRHSGPHQGSLGKQCTLGAQGEPGRECGEFPWRRYN